MIPTHVPDVTFHLRAPNPDAGGAMGWRSLTSADIFGGARVVLFAVPGAFTPACSETHLPGYEAAFDDFRALGIDQVICLSVNDAFVMGQWARSLGIEKVTMLPDGNGDFTRGMGMMVSRAGQGMGARSWRYAMLVEDGAIRHFAPEPDRRDDPPGVPVAASSAEAMLEALRRG